MCYFNAIFTDFTNELKEGTAMMYMAVGLDLDASKKTDVDEGRCGPFRLGKNI